MTATWAISPLAWEARRKAGDGPPPRLAAEGYTTNNGVAELALSGVVAPPCDWWWGGMTDPAALARAIRVADADPTVTSIRLIVDSPGGSGSAMRDAHMALRACRKPTEAYISGMCLSAAYWIASGCKRIVAHPLAMVGCIGTIVAGAEWLPKDEVRKVLRSSQTPDKAPSLASDGWDRQWQPILDEATGLFLGDISAARGWGSDAPSTAIRVQKGATLAATAALAAGLIDEIADSPSQAPAVAAVPPPDDATSKMKPDASTNTQQTRTAQGAMSMDPELEKVTAERDALAAKVAELEAEIKRMRDEDAAAAEKAKAEPEMAARLAALEGQLATANRERYIEGRLAAGELTPGVRKAVERLYAVGGPEAVEEVFPLGQKMIPAPKGHAQPAAAAGVSEWGDLNAAAKTRIEAAAKAGRTLTYDVAIREELAARRKG